MSEIERVTTPEEFVIDTDAKAEWALQKIREARADRDRFVEWYTAKIKEIKEQCDFNTMNLERMLAEYFETVPHRSTKTQEVYDLPSGKIFYSKQTAEYKRNDTKIIEWLKTHDGGKYIKVEESVDWASLKKNSAAVGGKLYDENGEEIDGVEVIDRPPVFKVEA